MSMDDATIKTSSSRNGMTCIICGDPIPKDAKGWGGGYNAEPIKDGRCCSKCNQTLVVPERLKRIQEGHKR